MVRGLLGNACFSAAAWGPTNNAANSQAAFAALSIAYANLPFLLGFRLLQIWTVSDIAHSFPDGILILC